MTMSNTDEFVMSRLFKAPRDRVWAAWTRPEQLARWFGPRDVTTTVVEADIRPGGFFHCRMDSADGGGTLWAKLVYREIVAPERLVWEHSFADRDGNIVGSPFSEHWPKRLLTTVLFDEVGADTRVRLSWVPIDATAEELREYRDAMPSFDDGWAGSYEALDRLLAQG
ncbi:SRPBCC domain-containing protein [Sphingomonas sp. C8-2]|jgi:uncharacterized protein YndB with AHSA1/START domain|nr:SRPBCC domain-containing protein [Sphingomonas sp. C8-2]